MLAYCDRSRRPSASASQPRPCGSSTATYSPPSWSAMAKVDAVGSDLPARYRIVGFRAMTWTRIAMHSTCFSAALRSNHIRGKSARMLGLIAVERPSSKSWNSRSLYPTMRLPLCSLLKTKTCLKRAMFDVDSYKRLPTREQRKAQFEPQGWTVRTNRTCMVSVHFSLSSGCPAFMLHPNHAHSADVE